MSLRVAHIVKTVQTDPGTVAVCLSGLTARLNAAGVESWITSDTLKMDADVIHIHGWGFGAALDAARQASLKKIPYVLSPQGALCFGPYNTRSLWQRVRSAFGERRCVRGAHHLLAMNDAEAQQLEKDAKHPSLRVWVGDTFSGASVRPEGAPDCSHGWSPAQPDGTRGVRGQESIRPKGAEERGLRWLPPPPPGRVSQRIGIHGLRFTRLSAGGAPPVATILGPSGTVPTPPKLSRTLRILPYGLSFDEYDNGRAGSSDLRQLLVLGSLHPRGGCVALLKALAELGPIANDWHVVFGAADTKGWRPMLEAAVRRKGGEDRVRFMDAPDVATQRKLIGESAVVVTPNLHPDLGIPVLQAAACGVPVIATTLAVPPGLNGTIQSCEPRRDALRDALRSMLSLSDEDRKRLGAGLKETARRTLDWSVLVDRYASLYGEVARG